MKKSTGNQILILVLLLAVLAVYGYYTLLLSPKIDEVKDIKKKVENEDILVRNMYNITLQYKKNAQVVREAKEMSRELTEHYFVRAFQEDFIDVLNSMLNNAKITFESIEASPYANLDKVGMGYRCYSPLIAYLPVDYFKNKSAEELTPEEAALLMESAFEDIPELPIVEEMTFHLEAEGNYSAIKHLVDEINSYDKHVFCDVISIDMLSASKVVKSEDPKVRVNMEIRFVCINDIPCLNEDDDIPEFPTDFVMPADFINKDY